MTKTRKREKPAADKTDNEVHLHQILTAALVRRFAINETAAAALAQEVASGLREAGGGEEVYIPAPDKNLRDAAVRKMFDGRNGEEVRTQFGLSLRQVYRIANGRRS